MMNIDIPKEYIGKWQDAVDILSGFFQVPVSLIMRMHQTETEVFIASINAENPYKVNSKLPFNSGRYCEKVIKENLQLHILDALDDDIWKDNPDLKYNMSSYLGLPINWPDNKPFGSLSVQDSRPIKYSQQQMLLMAYLRTSIEEDLQLIYQEYKEELAELDGLDKNTAKTLKHIINILPEAMVIHHNGEILYANRFFMNLMELEDNVNFVGRNYFDYFLGDQSSIMRNRCKAIINEKFSMPFVEVEIKTEQGSVKFIEGIDNFILYQKKSCVVTLLHDVTSRKQADEKLIERESYYRALYNDANDGIIVLGNGKFIDCNKKALELFDLKREELIGKTPYDISPVYQFDGTLSEEKAKTAINTVSKGKSMIFEWEHQKKDGILIDVEINLNKVNLDIDKFVILGFIRDLTERKKAELELKESEVRFRSTFDSAAVGISHVNLDGKFMMVNQKLCEITGYTFSELTRMSFQEITHPDDLEHDMLLSQKLKAGAIDTYTVEKRYLKKGGGIVWVKITPSVVWDEKGIALYYIGIVEDISGRKAIEQQVRIQSEALKNAPVSIVITDKDAHIQYVNPKFEELSGYALHEVFDQNPGILSSGIHSPEFYKEMWQKLMAGEIWQGEIKNKKKNGDCFWERASISSIKNEKEEITHFVAVKEDITRRKEYENEIKKNNIRLESLLKISQYKAKNLQDLLDFALNEALVLTESKLGFIYYYNEEKKEFLLNSWSKGVVENCSVENAEKVMQLTDTGCWSETVRQRKPFMVNNYSEPNSHKKGIPDGHVVLEKFLSIPVFVDDVIVAVVGVANKQQDYIEQDIKQLTVLMDSVWKLVEKERINSELKEAKDLAEDSNRLKSAFLATLSHEFRTPLNAITGFASLMNANQSITKLLEYNGIIQDNARYLTDIIESVLNFSILESKKIEVLKTTLSLEELIDDFNAKLISEIERRNKINIEIIKPDPEIYKDFTVHADHVKLKQIIYNLISNAVKFTETGMVKFGVLVNNKDLELFVKDTGVGIPEDKRKVVFDSFRQVDDTFTREYEGIGLGLAICKRLSDLIEGKLWFESKENKGTVFYLLLSNVVRR